MIGTIQERFESKFTKSEGCWEWNAYKNSDGYGVIWIIERVQKAHRVAYQLYVGEIPEGMCVCHRCDNPSCVNPEHLFLGTNADNVRDRDNKGRDANRCGEKNGRAKLTEAQVVEIRERMGGGERGVDLARQFGVTRDEILKIFRRISWASI